jgi:EAL domain-containing protein (putative c-di-GMP-specific phosphodiesterase class I)
MKRTPIQNEEARLNALRNLRLLDTEPSESFDRITRLASRLLNAPVSTVSLTDHDRQWFKSRFGVALSEIPRHEAPCHYAIQADELFIVPDLLEDPRFKDSVLARAGVRFYAGAPLITRSGYGLGTINVIDNKPRTINPDELAVLTDMAAFVMTQVEVQNAIGGTNPITGYPNDHQLFEYLADVGARYPNQRRTALIIELTTARILGEGQRVLGSAYAEEFVRRAFEIMRGATLRFPRFYHVGFLRSLIVLDEGDDWRELVGNLDIALREPIIAAGIPTIPEPVVGVYTFTSQEAEPRDVLRRLYNALDDGRVAGRFMAEYNETRDRAHVRSFNLLSELPAALRSADQLHLVYQPVIQMEGGVLAGAEALLRWRHPKLGDVSPGEFIPLVEETALTRQLTEWVINTAVAQFAGLRGSVDLPKISINASARNLEEEDFPDRLRLCIESHGVALGDIQLEFIETALVQYSTRVLDHLKDLATMGISIAIDDFGIGYSSLSYLRHLNANVLKIDQSFIRGLAGSTHDQKLVRAVIAMAHDLGYQVVAEGIEDRESYDMLRDWKCDMGQGYFIAHPMSVDQFADWRPKLPA